MTDKERIAAAAFDLLEALEALTKWHRRHTSRRAHTIPRALLGAAEAAIAKATGATP